MPRVRWRSVPVLCLVLHFFWIDSVNADCWFENQRHQEGNEVPTAEPCLNCTCRQGALVCYLRVCSELPDPPPPGCIVLHRHRTCCPELICTDIPAGNGIEARSEPDELEIDYNKSSLGEGCVENGTIYGPGSAMGSSSLCEHCYCIGGRQTCIKPRCLLHLDGCTPSFEPHSCCPVRYNCTGYHKPAIIFSSTTTQTPKDIVVRGGCIVSGAYYTEGSRILGVGHSVCDNCYCVRGMLRCEPLSCAPAILGCAPVVKPGQCCAASYNCNGTIEIQPEPNYGHYPTVSKEYAKLRKEVQQQRLPPAKFEKRTNSGNSNTTYYVIAESSHTATTKTHRSPGSFGTTRHILDPSTRGPFYYDTVSSSKSSRTTNSDAVIDIRTRPSTMYRKNSSTSGVFSGTTNYKFQNTNYKRPFLTTNTPKSTETTTDTIVRAITIREQTTPKQLRSSDYEEGINDDILSLVDSLFDNEIHKKVEEPNGQNTTTEITQISTAATSVNLSTTESRPKNTTDEDSLSLTNVLSTLISTLTEEDFSTTLDTNLTTILPVTADGEGLTTTEVENTETITENVELKTPAYSTALTALVTTTDCINSTNVSSTTPTASETENLQERHDSFGLTATEINEINNELEGKTSTTELIDDTSTFLTTTEKDITVVDLESKVKVDTITKHPYKPIPSEIEAILDKKKDYEVYDYIEPTLPPSLPNLQIIPFVAADALDADKHEQDNAVYPLPRERITEAPPYSLFSPPTKTEGGFVPKEPPIFHEYYENGYHTTGIDITSVTALPVPAITNPPKSHQHNCIADGREVHHGETVTAETCIMCVCFYGNIVCQQPQCPPPSPGCRRSTRQTSPTCCPQLICNHDVITSSPQEIVTVAEGIGTPDPFRDVIRTEPAPDLQSLIGDFMPYLARHSTTQKMTSELTTEAFTKVENVTTVTTANQPNVTSQEDEELSFNKVLELLFYGETTTEKRIHSNKKAENKTNHDHNHSTTYPSVESKEIFNSNLHQTHPNSVDSAAAVGILKLAGCNIYGRMYRVGRIISELSTPCNECKCTEIGVQCTPLKC